LIIRPSGSTLYGANATPLTIRVLGDGFLKVLSWNQTFQSPSASVPTLEMDGAGQLFPCRVRPDSYRIALKEAIMNRIFASVLLCTLLLVVLAFTTACGGHSKQIGTCLACPEEQAVYATSNSGQVLTFPFPLGTQLGTATSTAGPANSTGILVSGGIVYVSDPGNSAIRAYSINNQEPILSPASFGPFAVGASPGPMALFGQTLYVASSAGEIFAFTVNSDGSLTSLAGSPFAAGMGLSHLAVANFTNANFLYAANSDDPNGSISGFTINSDGSLTPVVGSPFQTVPNGGPEGLNVSEGNVLYLALKNTNAVAGSASMPMAR
jgi:hypothetical protein